MRKLFANEIETRISTINDKGCQLLLYKTARVDRAILDEKFGAMNWQTDFKTVNDNLYCGIGVFDKEKKQWIWKWDCGTESFSDKEKGEASDAFKRAGFKWGIGVELYNTPFIWIKPEVVQFNGKWMLADKFQKFEVSKIETVDGEVVELEIVDSKTKDVLFYFNKNKKAPFAQKKQPVKTATPVMKEDDFEERFIEAYKRLKTGGVRLTPKIEESFKSLMAEAEKRKYEDSKQEEMWKIFNSLTKDNIPTFTTKGA